MRFFDLALAEPPFPTGPCCAYCQCTLAPPCQAILISCRPDHSPGDDASARKLWACLACSEVSGRMRPEVWLASIRQSPYWWTTPELFRERARLIGRRQEPGFAHDLPDMPATSGTLPLPDSHPADPTACPSPQTASPDESALAQPMGDSNPPPRLPGFAQLHEMIRLHGTSIEEMEHRLLALTLQFIEQQGRPVSVDEIVAYIEEQEPHLLAMLQMIDEARARDRKTGKGKRLTNEQRQQILAMLATGQHTIQEIAKLFDVTYGSILRYKLGKVPAVQDVA